MSWQETYREVRAATERLARPLSPEDCAIQSMPDASPTKWHLGHTSWFFETFVLKMIDPARAPIHPQFGYLFNSYYNAVGDRLARPQRGMITRPSLDDVFRYRADVDREMLSLLNESTSVPAQLLEIVELGLHHEQQHQELLLTDMKHLLSINPLRPAYRDEVRRASTSQAACPIHWSSYPAGVRENGHAGSGFCYDNEKPRHQVFLNAFSIATRPLTNGEFLAFIDDAGYKQPEFWLSDGWDTVRAQGWEAPLYWEERDGQWWSFTLAGMQPLAADEPVCHVSFYEADAYARWADARLPSEAEWETAATDLPIEGRFVESGRLQPLPLEESDDPSAPRQMFGDVWEWTSSPYIAYPGYQPTAGALGEYNGKFMCNQMVLRGGSCATPRSNIRATYRNFFGPAARWQFSGFRLARDA
ncbi:MAG: ergothioneine biosynthesis protein EgtB [Planctomycetaceae bacterium]